MYEEGFRLEMEKGVERVEFFYCALHSVGMLYTPNRLAVLLPECLRMIYPIMCSL